MSVSQVLRIRWKQLISIEQEIPDRSFLLCFQKIMKATNITITDTDTTMGTTILTVLLLLPPEPPRFLSSTLKVMKTRDMKSNV